MDQAGHAGQQRAEHVDRDFRPHERYTGETGRLAVAAHGIQVLYEKTSTTMSAVWVKVEGWYKVPTIVGCIYHPPNLSERRCDKTLTHIEEILEEIWEKFGNINLIVCGDFNDLNVYALRTQYRLVQMVNFATRDDAILDLVICNNPEYYVCTRLPPLATSDHDSVIIW